MVTIGKKIRLLQDIRDNYAIIPAGAMGIVTSVSLSLGPKPKLDFCFARFNRDQCLMPDLYTVPPLEQNIYKYRREWDITLLSEEFEVVDG